MCILLDLPSGFSSIVSEQSFTIAKGALFSIGISQ